METEPNILLVVLGVPAICGLALYLWYLAKGSLQARLIIVALWLVFLAMSVIAGPPWAIVMGAATIMMGLWIYAQINPVWWRWW